MIVVLCAIFTYIISDIYGISGDGTLTLTREIKSGMPTPAVPKFVINVVDHETNKTITRNGFTEIAAVGTI